MGPPARYATSFRLKVTSVMRAVRRANSSGGNAVKSPFSGWWVDMGYSRWRSGRADVRREVPAASEAGNDEGIVRAADGRGAVPYRPARIRSVTSVRRRLHR